MRTMINHLRTRTSRAAIAVQLAWARFVTAPGSLARDRQRRAAAAIRRGLIPAGLERRELERRMRLLAIPPMAGAAGDDDEDDDDEGGKGGKGDDDQVKLTKAEHDRLKNKAAEGDRKVRKLEAKIEELEDAISDHSAGDDELEQTKVKLRRAEEKLAAAETKVEDLEGEIETGKRERAAIDVATRLGFRNAARAVRMLDSGDMESDADAERALERLAREEPYMLGKRGQRDVTNDDDAGDGDDDEGDGDKGARGGSGTNGNGSEELTGTARARSYYGEQASKGNKND